jgi:integral membrane protein
VFRTPLNLFRVMAVAEAISWTLLIAGLIVRATSDLAVAVTIGGGIHGFVFLSYGGRGRRSCR